ncbi:MAG: hypothetical protein Q9201_006351 [Fulgogasparrea decipioides]
MARQHEIPEMDLLSYIFDNEDIIPDKPVLVDATNPSRFLTTPAARTIIRKLIAGFRAEGLEEGDCVCINAFNDIYYPVLLLAIVGAGGRFTGSNPAYTSLELNHHIRVSQAKFVIAEPPMLATTLQSAHDCQIPASRVFTFETKDQTAVPDQRSWTSLLEHGEADWVIFSDPKQAKSTIATLSFTSGTTGFPKAAMIPHLYAINQLHTLKNQKTPYEVSRLICIPAFHAFAVPLMTGCAIREQQTVYIMRRFDLPTYLASIRRFQITEIAMVPTMLVAVLMSPLTKKDDLQSLCSVWVGGSPLRSSTQTDFQALLRADARVTQVWGMTETGWTTMLFWPERDNTGSVGRLIPGMNSKLVAEDGSIITEDNREGELFIKGASIMNGYYNDPVATAATIDEDGWLRTGDIAYCIRGKWYIVDRKKDIIKVHGWQVAPAELEAILLTHPQVVNAAVIGIPLQDGTGEVPQAFVVLKPRPLDGTYASHGELEEDTTTEEELKAFLASRLAKYKALDGVTFVQDIPRTPSGKLQKFKLREMYTKLGMNKKRKSNVLETIADRNAAMRNGTDLNDAAVSNSTAECNGLRESNGSAEGKRPMSCNSTAPLNGTAKSNGTTKSYDRAEVNGGTSSRECKGTSKSGIGRDVDGINESNGTRAEQHVNRYNTRKRVKITSIEKVV